MKTTLKVLTYNIHKGFSLGNRRFVLKQIKEQIQLLGVDMVFLQEVQGEHQLHAKTVTDWPQESQFEYLADQVWTHFAYGKNAVAAGRHHGNAILSKYPFIHWGNTNLSFLKSASRSLLYGDVSFVSESKQIHVVCLHLGLSKFERTRQVRELNEHIAKHVSNDDPIIVAGDFNDWSGKEIAKTLESSPALEEAYFSKHDCYANTFPSWYPFFKMDRIYFANLKLIDSYRLVDPQWKKLSDHVPLIAEFEVN